MSGRTSTDAAGAQTTPDHAATGAFDRFIIDVGGRVRRGLVACYGVEIGTEAAADAMSVAWERWGELSAMDNPAGFLFRVGQSKARPHVRWRKRAGSFPTDDVTALRDDAALIDLFAALATLRPAQRGSVVLVKSYGFSYREVADLLGLSEAAVTNHVHRGLAALRSTMKRDET